MSILFESPNHPPQGCWLVIMVWSWCQLPECHCDDDLLTFGGNESSSVILHSGSLNLIYRCSTSPSRCSLALLLTINDKCMECDDFSFFWVCYDLSECFCQLIKSVGVIWLTWMTSGKITIRHRNMLTYLSPYIYVCVVCIGWLISVISELRRWGSF